MNLENFAKMRALESADTSFNSDFVDHLLKGEQGEEIRQNLLSKRLQFDTTPELYAEVERICSLLHCSKRQFLRMAVCDAIDKADAVFMETYKDATGVEFGEQE